ncbi:hypothetical protein GCM10011507_32510 [Edaphobacter acidisoli]|uniref:Outer membrane protein beta-barrel domain-containing protein n=1 Tax=Edaphobacter acidisoli TaxID=2040573 RepID=A0A916S2Q1_9BACT|nr:hypothetical protein [Edaphobacter acidisoli]GGA78759.1 hypothetical protein GCM10011507_32510 [Edaphobacter acidisoli]
MNLRSSFFLPLVLALTCATLQAQARLAIYGTVGGESVAHQSWTTAGTLGAYVGVSGAGPISLAIDGRADLSSNIKSGLFGPRLAIHPPVFPIKPYIELLIGGSGVKNGSTSFAARYVLGADTTILPRVDWRILDFSDGLNDIAGSHPKTLSTGLVLRF